MFDSGDIVPLFYPFGQVSSGGNSRSIARDSTVSLRFSCSGNCVGSLLGRYTSEGANPSFFLTINFYLANSNGLVMRSLPMLTRNIMFNIIEPAGLVSQPTTGIRISGTDSSTASSLRRSKRRAR